MKLSRVRKCLQTSVLLPFLVIPAVAEPASGSGTEMQLTEKDSDRKVVLVVGTHLTIRLKAQLGTGYSWQFEALDVQVLESSGEPTTETIEEGKLGAAEMQVFRFTAKGVGTTALAFHYARHWEKDVKPMKTITFQVEVKPKS